MPEPQLLAGAQGKGWPQNTPSLVAGKNQEGLMAHVHPYISDEETEASRARRPCPSPRARWEPRTPGSHVSSRGLTMTICLAQRCSWRPIGSVQQSQAISVALHGPSGHQIAFGLTLTLSNGFWRNDQAATLDSVGSPEGMKRTPSRMRRGLGEHCLPTPPPMSLTRAPSEVLLFR